LGTKVQGVYDLEVVGYFEPVLTTVAYPAMLPLVLGLNSTFGNPWRMILEMRCEISMLAASLIWARSVRKGDSLGKTSNIGIGYITI
jgi:hypothetical protein